MLRSASFVSWHTAEVAWRLRAIVPIRTPANPPQPHVRPARNAPRPHVQLAPVHIRYRIGPCDQVWRLGGHCVRSQSHGVHRPNEA